MATSPGSPNVNARTQQHLSPQARGRELAAQGKKLWTELGSVKSVATELMARYQDVPSLQAYRYAAGLSQDQAALRYNEVTDNQTSLGGTSVNAWETWARSRGQGSPPSLSSLLILATAYGRGPLGVAEENISPAELIAEAYERLPIEDQLSLKKLTADNEASQATPHEQARELTHELDPGPLPSRRISQVGYEFSLSVPTVEYGNPEICVFTLPNPQPGQLLDLNWDTFGYGVERLSRQIKNLGRRLDVDICFGVNEAGLVMATFLSSSRFSRCPIGYLRCNKIRDGIDLDEASFFPEAKDAPTIVICDFEVKHADVIGYLTRQIRARYPKAELYFAVFGAMTKGRDLKVDSFDDLTGALIMRAADFAAVFIAATMSPPGIEPPLELR
jgi:transcriptional regulator with XRE-family HTH domain